MNTSSDRAQVRQLGELQHPAACALCGNGTCVDGYLDTGVFYDYEGTVYFCWRCVEQFCAVVGALLPEEVSRLKQDATAIAERNATLEAENNELRSKLDAWYTVLDGAADRSNPVPRESVNEDAEFKPGSADEPSAGSEARKPVAKKSVARRRSNDAAQPTASDFAI